MDAEQRWNALIEQAAQDAADRDNEDSSHCGPYGTDTADDHRDGVREEFTAIGKAYMAMSAPHEGDIADLVRDFDEYEDRMNRATKGNANEIARKIIALFTGVTSGE